MTGTVTALAMNESYDRYADLFVVNQALLVTAEVSTGRNGPSSSRRKSCRSMPRRRNSPSGSNCASGPTNWVTHDLATSRHWSKPIPARWCSTSAFGCRAGSRYGSSPTTVTRSPRLESSSRRSPVSLAQNPIRSRWTTPCLNGPRAAGKTRQRGWRRVGWRGLSLDPRWESSERSDAAARRWDPTEKAPGVPRGLRGVRRFLEDRASEGPEDLTRT